MKFLQFFLLHICLFSIIACANNQSPADEILIQKDTSTTAATAFAQDSFPLKKIIPKIICRNDATQSYALYIPSEKPSAIIYFFDPQATGSLPLENYKALADANNFILAGSNNSKNGNDFETAEKIWQNLFNDTKSRIALNTNRIYVCGFSGGAKVASYLALHHPQIKSVIAGGAGLPDGTPASNFNFSFTGITGKGDMNMTGMAALNNEFDKTQTKHCIIFFNGKHEWAPANIMNIAFAGLSFNAMRNKIISKNDEIINTFINNSKKRIDSCVKKNDWIQASSECMLAINMLDGLTDEESFFNQKNNTILNNTDYKNQLLQQQKLFTIEENKKAEYNAKFQNGDMQYWNNTINDLNSNAKAQTAEGTMYQRLLAYLSLAFYSISNQLINQNQNDQAVYFVNLYKLADPANSEAWYFAAILDARKRDANAVNKDLFTAVKNGFNDKERMLKQHEFQSLQPTINYAEIEDEMNK